MRGRLTLVAVAVVSVLCAATPALASDVSVGSPPDTTPQNHQNEPAVAIDANNPSFAVAGWNDFVDWAPCPQADATQFGTCADPADDGVGLSSVAFSFDKGNTWVQPTYTGWTAADCVPTTTCTAHEGPIHTLPWYYENRLVSSGDPAVAVGHASTTRISRAPGRRGLRFRIQSFTAISRSACRASTIRRRRACSPRAAGRRR